MYFVMQVIFLKNHIFKNYCFIWHK